MSQDTHEDFKRWAFARGISEDHDSFGLIYMAFCAGRASAEAERSLVNKTADTRPSQPEKNAPHKFYAAEKWLPHIPGVFMYSGLGSGYYWSIDGFTHPCTASEAQEWAKREGVEYHYVDSFAFHGSMGSSISSDFIRAQVTDKKPG